MLYAEQQKMIEDDILPGIFGQQQHEEVSFVDKDGDRWFSKSLLD